MKRFLKREWDSLEIPPTLLERSREEAWQRLRQPRRRFSLWWPAAALAAAALLLAFLRLATAPDPVPPGPQLGRQSQPAPALPPPVAAPEATAPETPPETRPLETAVQPVAPPAQHAAVPRPPQRFPPEAPPEPAPAERVQRVVMHFQLPDSGVRLIWVKDENFSFGGE